MSELGSSVAIDGDTVAMGARDYDSRGAVFIYAAGSATPHFRVQPDNLEPGDQFGDSSAVYGDTLVVGAPGKANGAGAVYMYQRLGLEWVQKAFFQGGAGQRLGSSVDIFGDIAIVGAENSNQALFYNYNGSTWSQNQAILDASTRGVGGRYGAAVSIHENTAIIGAPQADFGRGIADVFLRSGNTWSLQRTIYGSNSGATGGHEFGAAVDISGDVLAVGAPGTADSRGAVYTYGRSGDNWPLLAPLTIATGSAGDLFGSALAVDNNQLIVGASGARRPDRPAPNNNNRGAAYSFRLQDGAWIAESALQPIQSSETEPGDQFGYAVDSVAV
jgi:hypothetical protein